MTEPSQMPDQLQWGILGAGNISRAFAADLVESGRLIRAVAARSLDHAERFAREFSIPVAYEGYEALVDDPAIDIVYVATPNTLHGEHALLAIEAGKHVLVEKPFTLNQREAEFVAERAAAKGVFVMEAMWTRFLPHMVKLRELVADGVIGEVHTVIADHTQLLPADPHHRVQDPALGGGALLDLGIYPISFAVDLLGVPEEIQASAALTPLRVDARVETIMRHPGGASSLTNSALDQSGPTRAAVIGNEGWVEIDSIWYQPSSFTVFDADRSAIIRYEEPVVSRGMQYEAFEVEACIESGERESAVMPLSESVQIMGVLDEIRAKIGVEYPSEHD